MGHIMLRNSDMVKQYAAEWERFRLIRAYGQQSRKYPHQPGPVKYLLDSVGAAVGLAALFPLMTLIALLIKLTSRGPVFYRQERVGLNGRTFTLYKFRSMVVDAEAAGPCWAKGEADSRVTGLGKWLRFSHLDELPQLWNVLKGEMSLIGPRPERPCFVQELRKCVPGYDKRHAVKPGITGLAQVHYHYDANIADVRRKLRFDRLYVDRACFRLNLLIFARTFSTVMSKFLSIEPREHSF